MNQINSKIEKVKEELANKKVAISFSGGADSTLLGYLAKEVCDDVILVTYNNCIMPTNFLELAKKKASEIGIKHEIIENDFINIDIFVKNSSDRCYICRKLMYDAIKQVANNKNYQIIIDGTNISDVVKDRPGLLVNYKYNIESPFIKAELESNEIHKYLEENHLSYSKSTTCLGTRIKTGKEITSEKINRISYCEDIIKEIINSEEIRLREENNSGIIEIKDLEKITKDQINQIRNQLKPMNYNKLLLNLNLNGNKENFLNYQINPINNKIILEKTLPYKIDLNITAENIEKIANIKKIRLLEDIDFINIQFINNESITIFKSGKITGKNFNSKESAKNTFIKVLKQIKREKIEKINKIKIQEK